MVTLVIFILVKSVTDKEGKDKDKDKPGASQLAVPRLSVCADVQKVDRTKLAQIEVSLLLVTYQI